jgi:hypothetical protein
MTNWELQEILDEEVVPEPTDNQAEDTYDDNVPSFEVEEDSEGESYRSCIPAADQPEVIGDSDYEVAQSETNNPTDLPRSTGDESRSTETPGRSDANDNEYIFRIDQYENETEMQSNGTETVNDEYRVATGSSATGHDSIDNNQPVSNRSTQGHGMTVRANRAKRDRWAKYQCHLVHKIKPNNKNRCIKKAIENKKAGRPSRRFK